LIAVHDAEALQNAKEAKHYRKRLAELKELIKQANA